MNSAKIETQTPLNFIEKIKEKYKSLINWERSPEKIKESINNIQNYLEKIKDTKTFTKYAELFPDSNVIFRDSTRYDIDWNSSTIKDSVSKNDIVIYFDTKNMNIILEDIYQNMWWKRWFSKISYDWNTDTWIRTNDNDAIIGKYNNWREIISKYEKQILKIESKMKKQIMMKKIKNTIQNTFSKKKALD